MSNNHYYIGSKLSSGYPILLLSQVDVVYCLIDRYSDCRGGGRGFGNISWRRPVGCGRIPNEQVIEIRYAFNIELDRTNDCTVHCSLNNSREQQRNVIAFLSAGDNYSLRPFQ